MKKALGGRAYKNYWLLRPSVVRHLVSYASRFGTGTSDVLHEKTNLLGGTLVLSKEGKVVHEFRETSSFYQGEAADLTLTLTLALALTLALTLTLTLT